MVLKVTQIAPEVIFAKPEVTCFEPEVNFFVTGNDFCGSFNVFVMRLKDFYVLESG